MRKFALLVLALCVVVGSLSAIDLQTAKWDAIVAAAKAEGSVTFYAWYFPDYFKEAAADFEKLYGIKANVIIGDQTANFNKAIAEKDMGTGTIDVMIVGGQWVKTTLDLNLFYGPIKGIFPDAALLAPSLWEVQEGVIQKGYLAPFHRNQTGILYDPQRVSNPPQTWAELVAWIDAHPKEFGFNDPSKGGSGQSFVHTVIAQTTGGLDKYKGDQDVVPSKVANWNIAWKWFTDRMDKLTLTVSNNDSIIRMNGGEISMTVAWGRQRQGHDLQGQSVQAREDVHSEDGSRRRRRHDGRSQKRQEQGGRPALDQLHPVQGTAAQEIQHGRRVSRKDRHADRRDAAHRGRSRKQCDSLVPGRLQDADDQ